VADHGVAAHEADVQRLIERARGRGMRSGALQALEDRSAADVVRARALAVVLSQLRRSGGV
jgi:ribosomal protein L19E